MNRQLILLALGAIVITTLACGVDINIPVTVEVKTGPTVTDEINVPRPTDPTETTRISLSFGAGELKIAPGIDDALINGTATYNVEDFKPEVDTSNNSVTITQGNLEIRGLPKIDATVKNDWDLKLGQYPVDLIIKAGGYTGALELGGLSISDLHISDGASDVDLLFSQPNQVEMNALRYETGASDVSLEGLSNANFNTMVFQSGAGNYTLDFSGQLKRDSIVFIETGLSNLTILIPEGIPAEITVEGRLNNVSMRGNWDKFGDTYINRGEGPQLDITVEMGAGNLTLRHP